MADGIMIASDCADWWDEQLKNYKQELEEYVLENPGNWGIAVATVKATGADFAHMFFVDLLRLGEGVAQGGVKGLVQDLFRVMQFIPPGKVLAPARGLLGTVVQRVASLLHWRWIEGGLCAPIAIAQALQRTGQKFGVSLKEIAETFGKSLDEIHAGGVDPKAVTGALQKLGVEFSVLLSHGISKFDDLLALAKTTDGPVLVRIIGQTMQNGKLVVVGGHRILVGKTMAGMKIIDRYGAFNNLDDLARRYNIHSFVIDAGESLHYFKNAVIDDKLITLANRFGILASLARVSLGVFDFNRTSVTPEFVKQDFQRFVEKRRASTGPVQGDDIVVVGGKNVEVVAGDPSRSTLSGIAKAEYGTWELWPLIYDLNKDKIGANPNRIRPGLQLLVLPLPRYTEQEIASAKRRAPTWKNYPL